MNLTGLFDDNINDIESFNRMLHSTMTSETFVLPTNMPLYPKPIDTDDLEPEIVCINRYKPDSDEETEPEYAMIMDLELKPTDHFESPTFIVFYHSRLYYMDAYALVTDLFIKSAVQ